MTRVILATDGELELGLSDPKQPADYIAEHCEIGLYLSMLGFGRGNLNDATPQAQAKIGNGYAAFIDTLSEGQKAFLDKLSGALFPVAEDVKIHSGFNPAEMSKYHLIGQDTPTLRRKNFKVTRSMPATLAFN